MNAYLRCDDDGETTSAVYRLPGAELESTFVWVQGSEPVAKVVEESWLALIEERGFTMEVRLVDVDPGECSGPDQVVLATLYNDKGSRVQGIAVDPQEWPGGPWSLIKVADGPVQKARTAWASLGAWRWLVLAAAVAGALYVAKNAGKWMK